MIAAIDEKSLKTFQNNGISWQWPREIYSVVNRYLKAAGAKSVTYDLLFYEKDINRLNTNSDYSDSVFSKSIAETDFVFLANQLTGRKQTQITESQTKLPLLKGDKDIVFNNYPLTEYSNILLPINKFFDSALGSGYVNYSPDNDEITRRFKPFHKFRNRAIPQLSVEAFLKNMKLNKTEANKDYLKLDESKFSLDDGYFWIKWYGKGGPGGVYSYYSFDFLFKLGLNYVQGKNLDNINIFKNKYVFIGVTAPGEMDYRSTPFTSEGAYPGVEIYAVIFNNLLQNDFVRYSDDYIYWLLLSISIILLTILFFSLRKILLNWTIFITVGISALFLSCYLYYKFNLIIPLFPILQAMALSGVHYAVFQYKNLGVEKKEIKHMFENYLSPDVVKTLIDSPENLQLGGKNSFATVMFADIANFTTYSENKEPYEVVQKLNSFLEKIAEIIISNKGFIDKYTGDGVMAIFGAPLYTEHHGEQACQTALEISRFFKEITESNQLLSIRIGINSDEMVVGNVGSKKKMNYTAIGDGVNTGSRLEGVNKIYGTNILISENTKKLIKGKFNLREIDSILVKGKEEPITVYEVLEEDFNTEVKNNYLKGLELYRKMKWNDAIKILEKNDGDKPSKVLIERCRYYIINKPREDWDGIYTMRIK